MCAVFRLNNSVRISCSFARVTILVRSLTLCNIVVEIIYVFCETIW